MSPEEYAALQALIAQQVVSYTSSFGKFFLQPVLPTRAWLELLGLLYPQVQQARERSADLARTFQDSQRALFHPELPTLARQLEPYEFQWFVQALEPVRKGMSAESSSQSDLAQLTLQVVHEVENAGRKQIIKGVQSDEAVRQKILEVQGDVIPAAYDPVSAPRVKPKPEPSPVLEQAVAQLDEPVPVNPNVQMKPRPIADASLVQGWARVATGRETCAWCLMLISRGPVYTSAAKAGADLEDWLVAEKYAAGTDISQWMDEWHPGCDCLVVPVYDLNSWPGMSAASKAMELWVDAQLEADQILADNPDKLYYSQKEGRWLPTTAYRESLNVLRRSMERGDVSVADLAGLKAA